MPDEAADARRRARACARRRRLFCQRVVYVQRERVADAVDRNLIRSGRQPVHIERDRLFERHKGLSADGRRLPQGGEGHAEGVDRLLRDDLVDLRAAVGQIAPGGYAHLNRERLHDEHVDAIHDGLAAGRLTVGRGQRGFGRGNGRRGRRLLAAAGAGRQQQ